MCICLHASVCGGQRAASVWVFRSCPLCSVMLSVTDLELASYARLTGQWAQGLFCLCPCSTGMKRVPPNAWLFSVDPGVQTQAIMLTQQALCQLNYFPARLYLWCLLKIFLHLYIQLCLAYGGISCYCDCPNICTGHCLLTVAALRKGGQGSEIWRKMDQCPGQKSEFICVRILSLIPLERIRAR